MTSRTPETYRGLADAAWGWVLDQVRWAEDGPWIPESVATTVSTDIPEYRDGMHSGVGGLAYVLAEIRCARPWTTEEQRLADGIAERVGGAIPEQTDVTFFDGLVSAIGVLTALESRGAAAAVERLQALAAPDGWPQTFAVPPHYLPDARINDMTLGTAAVLLGALWVRRTALANGGGRAATGEASAARELAERAAAVLLAEAVSVPTGLDWPFVPERFLSEPRSRMPNLSHGLAGIAATLTIAGVELDRPDLVSAARRGAEHLITLGVSDGHGFIVPRTVPHKDSDHDEFTYNWCHGPAGTSLLFAALDHAGVEEVADEAPLTWHRRCLHSVRTSGLPERLHPGFWDNDGRCCGTAGVGEVFLDSWQRSGDEQDLEFALQLADTLVERAILDGPHAYWRFVEHRAPEPLLPPGVGWMQGAAGIAAYLFRIGRVVQDGPAADTVPRMDTWWAPPADDLSGARPRRW